MNEMQMILELQGVLDRHLELFKTQNESISNLNETSRMQNEQIQEMLKRIIALEAAAETS